MKLPEEFLQRMKHMLSDDYDNFINTFNSETFYIGLRLNPQKNDTENLFSDILSDCKKVDWCRDGYYCTKDIFSGNHPYHVAGMCYFQEPSAMSCVEALNIQPDDFVLDLCAAPGGKSTQAGAKLSQNGLLISNEIIPKRAAILAQNIERFGFSNTIVTNENPENLSKKFPEFFDKIIVDAPCSGEGMFKKEPQAVDEWSINHTLACAQRQKHILDSAYTMLKPGGFLAYSTCTFAPCENEGVIDYMLSTYTDLHLVPTGLDMLSPGNAEWVNSGHDMSLTRRIFPHLQKGEGHFIAVLEKDGSSQKTYQSISKPDKATENAVNLYYSFEKEYLNIHITGNFKLFGENLYLIPHGINIDKLKLARAGLHLGVCKKNRFEPSHALAMSLNFEDAKNSISYSASSDEIKEYLHGNVIPTDLNGYTLVAVDNNPIGWGKASCGILKNHFPKYLRQL